MTEPKRHRGRRAALWTAGVAAGAASAALVGRTLVRRSRGRADPNALRELAELPPEDLGPVRSFDGLELCVRAAGDPDTPVVVFVHGFSLDLTMWRRQWGPLSERYRCVLVDQRGHGRSDRSPEGDYTLQAMGRDLRAVLDSAVGDRPCVVVGHSMGGMSLLALAEAHPEEFGGRIRGVVLADTAAAELVRGAVGLVGARLEALLRPRLRAALTAKDRGERFRRLMQTRAADLAYGIARVSNFGPKADPAVVEHITSLSLGAPLEVWTDVLVSLLEMDLTHAIEHVKVPTLVVVGDLDRLTPPTTALAIKRALPDAKLVVMKGAGHIPMLERHEQFNRLLEGFLERAFREAPAGRKRSKKRSA